MKKHKIVPIDLLVVNLYPFGDPIEMARRPFEEAVELIDVGGPAMIRAGAKNHEFVAVVTDPVQYKPLSAMIARNCATTMDYRMRLMRAAFKYTADYDKRVHDSFEYRWASVS